MSTNTYSINRSFIFENEHSRETKTIKGNILIRENIADLKKILEQFGELNDKTLKIYDPSSKNYSSFQDFNDYEHMYHVPSAFLEPEIILIKYFMDSLETKSLRSNLSSKSCASGSKKQRSRERTIAEAIEIVKQWRQIPLNPVNGRIINLQEAAAILGVSKKSLDDYYYQLRLGEQYGFDFKNNLRKKVGVLRNYIKQVKHQKKKQNKTKTQKHPKQLKIIQQMNESKRLKEMKEVLNSPSNSVTPNTFCIMSPEISIENSMEEEEKMETNSLKQIEDQFYNQFDYFVKQSEDPFLHFGENSRRIYDDLSQLFF